MSDYLESVSPSQRSRIEGTLDARGGGGRAHDECSGDLIAHYAGQYPIWVFLEVVEFGVLVDLWRYCSGRWGERGMRDEHYVLTSVKALRNACAHNLCANAHNECYRRLSVMSSLSRLTGSEACTT